MTEVSAPRARADPDTWPPPLEPLVVRFGRIGDMVMHAPFLECLHLRYGRPCNLVSTGAWSEALFGDNPHVGAIRVVRDRHTPFALSVDRWKLVAELRKHEGPVYVSETLASQSERIRTLLAYAHVPFGHCVFLDDVRASEMHGVDQLLRFAAWTPLAWSPSDYPYPTREVAPVPTLDAPPADREDCDAWLKRRGWTGNPIVLLQPGSKHTIKWGRQRDRAKAWPLERWCELIRLMSGRLRNAMFVLCGATHERRLLKRIRDQCHAGSAAVAVATSDLPLRRLMALMRFAHSMVSVDTGPAHLAAALACPVVVIYGNESPRVWRRRGRAPNLVVELGGPLHGARADAVSTMDAYGAWLNLGHRV